MPTPPKTSRQELVRIARELVEQKGAEAVTLTEVAQRAKVKTPSLYKHFADRDALLKAVEIDVLYELEGVLRAGTRGRTAQERLASMAQAYRRYAKEQPRRYGVIYSRNTAEDPELAEACMFSARPLFEELQKAGVPEKDILPVSRTLTAFLHGFVSMEIVNAFRLGGTLEEDFAHGLRTVLAAVPERVMA